MQAEKGFARRQGGEREVSETGASAAGHVRVQSRGHTSCRSYSHHALKKRCFSRSQKQIKSAAAREKLWSFRSCLFFF